MKTNKDLAGENEHFESKFSKLITGSYVWRPLELTSQTLPNNSNVVLTSTYPAESLIYPIPSLVSWPASTMNTNQTKVASITDDSQYLARLYIALGTDDPSPELVEFEKNYYNQRY